MKLDVITLDGGTAGSIELDDALFGLEPRRDILHRVVRWQRNKAQAGTHKVKTRSEVSYSTKKIVRQKGSGGARHGSRKAPIFRGGGTYKGPTPRSHGHELTKKVRRLGLMHALSAKAQAGQIVVLDALDAKGGKTGRSGQAGGEARLEARADHRRGERERGVRAGRAQPRQRGRAPVDGRERDGHPQA